VVVSLGADEDAAEVVVDDVELEERAVELDMTLDVLTTSQ
jgi:hypothetical protein